MGIDAQQTMSVVAVRSIGGPRGKRQRFRQSAMVVTTLVAFLSLCHLMEWTNVLSLWTIRPHFHDNDVDHDNNNKLHLITTINATTTTTSTKLPRTPSTTTATAFEILKNPPLLDKLPLLPILYPENQNENECWVDFRQHEQEEEEEGERWSLCPSSGLARDVVLRLLELVYECWTDRLSIQPPPSSSSLRLPTKNHKCLYVTTLGSSFAPYHENMDGVVWGMATTTNDATTKDRSSSSLDVRLALGPDTVPTTTTNNNITYGDPGKARVATLPNGNTT